MIGPHQTWDHNLLEVHAAGPERFEYTLLVTETPVENLGKFKCYTHVKTHKLLQSANKLLQICSQAVDKLCSHCLFPVVVTSLEQAVNNL
jgi:hypothetical protein